MQLEWIASLQGALQSPLLNQIFIFWDKLDSFWFVLTFIGVLWYLVDRSLGIRVFYLFFLSFVINTLLKNFFGVPRPCHVDPTLGLVCHQSLAFPSGASQSAALYAGLSFFETKKTFLRVLAVFFALSLCFSRVYLGVHYPTDILGGLGVGALLLILYRYGFPHLKPYSRTLSFLLPLALVSFGPKLHYLAGACFGIALGLQFKTHVKRPYIELVSVLIGIFFFNYFGVINPSLKPLFALCAGFWFSYFSSFFIRLFR